MKKYFTIFFLTRIFMMDAQVVFCPPGAEWHYLFFGYNLCTQCWTENEKITYDRDSVVAGDTVRVLSHIKEYNKYNKVFKKNRITIIRQTGDTIWFRGARTQHTWQVLYNFNVIPGDSWTVIFDGYLSRQFTVIVLKKDLIGVNNKPLQRLKVEVRPPGYDGFWSDTVTIVERFGADNFMFYFRGYEVSDGDFFLQSLCYEDTTFGLVEFSSLPCDHFSPVGLMETLENKIKVFPSITSDAIRISGVKISPEQIRILTVIGRDVTGLIQCDSSGLISLQNLVPGIYFLQIQNKDGSFYSKKFVKI